MKNRPKLAEKLGKTADFVISLIFSTSMLLDHMFLNIFTNHLLRKIRLCMTNINTHIDIFKKNSKLIVEPVFRPQIANCDNQF